MANNFLKRPLAEADLDSIWYFIAADNIAAADKLLDRIGSVFAMLLDNPKAGRARPELAPQLRSFAVGNYVIFYSDVSLLIPISQRTRMRGTGTGINGRWRNTAAFSRPRENR